MTIRQLTTYLPFWEEMEKLLNKQIESKEILTEVQSILNRAYMKALEVGFEEGVKNSLHNMEAFAEWCHVSGWRAYTDDAKTWICINKMHDPIITTAQLREMWEKERKEEQK